MNTAPLRRSYGVSPSILIGLTGLAILFIAANLFFVLKTDYGTSFYSYWLSGRVLFAQGGNPYDPALFDQTRQRFPLEPNFSGFVYPLFLQILTLPFSFINNFEIALVLWMLILEAAAVLLAIKTLSALQIGKYTFSNFSFASLLLGAYFTVMSIIDGDIGILAVMLLILAMDAIRDNDDELAGILLSFSLIKYSLTLLPILWVSIWLLAHRRGGVVVWTIVITSLLSLISALFMSNWIIEFLRSIVYYFKYLEPAYFARLIEQWQPELGGKIGWAISGVFAAILILEWALNAKGGVRAFEWVFALTIAIGFLIGFPNIGKNLFALWVPLAYALDKVVMRWTKKGKKFSVAISISVALAPWLLNLFVFSSWDNPINIMCIILPLLTTILLYWNRWWNLESFIEGY